MSTTLRGKILTPQLNHTVLGLLRGNIIVVAKYLFVAEGDSELLVTKGDILKLLDRPGDGWLLVKFIDKVRPPGLVPASYVDIAVNDVVHPITLPWLHAQLNHEVAEDILSDINYINVQTKGQPPTTVNNVAIPVLASVANCLFYNQRIWYRLDVEYSDGTKMYLARYYQDFYNLHITLLGLQQHAEELAGTKNTAIALPKLPEPIPLGAELALDEDIPLLLKRCQDLNVYINKLILNKYYQMSHALGNWINTSSDNRPGFTESKDDKQLENDVINEKVLPGSTDLLKRYQLQNPQASDPPQRTKSKNIYNHYQQAAQYTQSATPTRLDLGLLRSKSKGGGAMPPPNYPPSQGPGYPDPTPPTLENRRTFGLASGPSGRPKQLGPYPAPAATSNSTGSPQLPHQTVPPTPGPNQLPYPQAHPQVSPQAPLHYSPNQQGSGYPQQQPPAQPQLHHHHQAQPQSHHQGQPPQGQPQGYPQGNPEGHLSQGQWNQPPANAPYDQDEVQTFSPDPHQSYNPYTGKGKTTATPPSQLVPQLPPLESPGDSPIQPLKPHRQPPQGQPPGNNQFFQTPPQPSTGTGPAPAQSYSSHGKLDDPHLIDPLTLYPNTASQTRSQPQNLSQAPHSRGAAQAYSTPLPQNSAFAIPGQRPQSQPYTGGRIQPRGQSNGNMSPVVNSAGSSSQFGLNNPFSPNANPVNPVVGRLKNMSVSLALTTLLLLLLLPIQLNLQLTPTPGTTPNTTPGTTNRHQFIKCKVINGQNEIIALKIDKGAITSLEEFKLLIKQRVPFNTLYLRLPDAQTFEVIDRIHFNLQEFLRQNDRVMLKIG